MLVVVTYDVSTVDKGGQTRLRKVAKICQNYGQRVQNSVFECIVDASQLTQLRYELIKTIDKEKDSLRFYQLGNNHKSKIEHIGTKMIIDVEDVVIF